jgi:hypothetical protein
MMIWYRFISYKMINGYIRYKHDESNRIYRIIDGKVKCGNNEYINPNTFCQDVYDADKNDFYYYMLYSDESKFSWMSPHEMYRIGIENMDLLIRSYQFENYSRVSFINKYTKKYNRRKIKNNLMDGCKSFYSIIGLVKGDFMDGIYVKSGTQYMNLTEWKKEIMKKNNTYEHSSDSE